MTYDGINIGEAVQPIQDRVETFQSNGYAVISPGDALSAGAYAVTLNSGNLDASDTLSVGSSNDEILFDGSTKSLSSATNVRINSVSPAGDGTEQYRYDVIYADSSGEVQKTEGSVTKLDSRESQNNLTRFERFKGAIPNPSTDPSVIIAAVIVNSNDTSVGTSQLRDYRVSATHKVSALETKTTNITDEAMMIVEKESNQSYSKTNGNVTVTWDSVITDKTDDFDLANNQFTPPETGTYLIDCTVQAGSFSDQDSIEANLVDTSSSTVKVEAATPANGGSWREDLSLTAVRDLQGGNTHKILFQNFDSDDEIQGKTDGFRTRLGIFRIAEGN